ncbi:MAG: UDP-N-acetyl-D-glucosamine dehydrogenase [Chloroflexota bacterium]|nr:UDP-N-acetyl-D-glucosamine dehydrogenase [Chloroflexota bacterium]
MTRVGIIGLGYVGLPLATAFAETGVDVLGVDVSAEKVGAISAGISYVEDVDSGELAQLVASGCLRASTDPSGLRACDAILICLPTPLDEHRNPDLSYVIAGAEMAAANLGPDALVVLESTTYPGTTREVLKPILEREGRRVGEDLFLAFSPERVDPGNPRFGIRNTPKIVGGMTDECTRRAKALYDQICEEVHVVSSPESAEMSKILENTFRAVNIALVNEMAMLCDRMDIDLWEAIGAASTKPFGYMAFWPGPGLGGHCIPIDPYYLTWRAKAYDLTTEFVELAGRINGQMPYYAVQRVIRALNRDGRAANGSKILLLGMAYKPNVADMRESPSIKLLALLRAEGADVEYHDPHVATLPDVGLASVPLTVERIAAADCVVIATDHRAVDLAPVLDHARRIVDLRNAVRRSLDGGPAGPVPSNVDVL